MKKPGVVFLFCLLLLLLTACTNNMDPYYDIISKVVEINVVGENYLSKATGTIISADGIILTNKHVVENKTDDLKIIVMFDDNDKYEASVYKLSNDFDLCLLKIDKQTQCFSNISLDIAIGQEVYSLSNIYGCGLALSKGIISSKLKKIKYNDEEILSIQTTLEIYGGSSGAPLYDSKGNLLGIITFRLNDNGVNIPGMSFAIPSISIKQFLERESIDL